ncbi:hypothetical protein C1H46_023729 [Malus baccata]|uniref:Tropinone reductase I n=1 Tax=Malus baccata TaxID=106549 RepID=A0A540LWG8_MALBA|nr:hypothetical protein C1H46_023729 [Malus baccata]
MSSIEINALLYLVVYWLLTLFLCILCIRYAIRQELAGLGATVHTCSRNEAQIVERLQEWEDKRFKVTGSVCDLTFKAQRENFIKTVSSIFNGKLNILDGNSDDYRHFIGRTPLRRTANPNEISCLVTFLCLPAASYINGQVVSVDGGFTVSGF